MSATSSGRSPGRRTTSVRIPLKEARRIAGRLIATARYRAGGKVRLNKELIARRITKGRSELTGVPFNLDYDGDSTSNPLAPSLDRINPGAPYSTSTVLITSWFENRARADLSPEDFRCLLLQAADALR